MHCCVEYYDVIAQCDATGESILFVEFMLACILDSMENYEQTIDGEAQELHDKVHDKVADKVANKSAQKVLMLLHENSHLTRDELSQRTGLSLGGIKKSLTPYARQG